MKCGYKWILRYRLHRNIVEKGEIAYIDVFISKRRLMCKSYFSVISWQTFVVIVIIFCDSCSLHYFCDYRSVISFLFEEWKSWLQAYLIFPHNVFKGLNLQGPLLFTIQSRLLTTLKKKAFENILGKEKMLVTSIFCFTHNVLYPSKEKFSNSGHL